MASYDSGTLTNQSSRSARIYKDLNLDFQQNTATKDIQKITDVESVKRSVRNLINLNHYEKPFHPEISGGVRELLFEHMNPMTSVVIARKIEDVINNFEPRCRLVSVRAIPDYDKNAYNVSVEFYVVNAPTELVDLSVMLERLR